MFYLNNLFIKNDLFLFYIGLKDKNNFNITFKKKYKLYTFFYKYNKYFLYFFKSFVNENLSIFHTLNFLQFILKKNFYNANYKLLYPYISNSSLLFLIIFFINKNKIKPHNIYKNYLFFFKSKGFKNFKTKFFFTLINYKTNKFYNYNLIGKKLSLFKINYSGTSLGKFINNLSLENLKFYYLRKTRVFNKGRYSRNRQNYRTGVYWCLYINTMVLYGLYFYFYRFTFNFGYLWWLFFVLILSFFLPRAVKYRLYDPKVCLKIILESKPLFFYIF